MLFRIFKRLTLFLLMQAGFTMAIIATGLEEWDRTSSQFQLAVSAIGGICFVGLMYLALVPHKLRDEEPTAAEEAA